MPAEGAFQVEGVIVEALPNGTYWAELANGHRLRAFVSGGDRRKAGRLAPGARVKLQLSPYDLSSGRMMVENENS